MAAETFNVTITSPEKIIWKGRAESVSSKNTTGPFDILAGHENFITMVQNDPITIAGNGKAKTFQYENAVITVLEGNVTIYADI